MKKIIMLTIVLTINLFANSIPLIPVIPAPSIPNEEKLPILPTEDLIENSSIRKLLSNTTVIVESKVNVKVPLEIISDIDINAMVIDDEIVEVPFSLELNKKPDILNYYKVKYSEDKIDIDNDGKIDTRIYSPKFLNKKIIEDNMVVIEGENISKEGTHEKKVYMTIEVKQ